MGTDLFNSFFLCKDPRFYRIIDVLPVKAEHKGEIINKDEGLYNKLTMNGTIQPAGFSSLMLECRLFGQNQLLGAIAPQKCGTSCQTTFDHWPHQTLFDNTIIVINGT